jgi:hypothetical protein
MSAGSDVRLFRRGRDRPVVKTASDSYRASIFLSATVRKPLHRSAAGFILALMNQSSSTRTASYSYANWQRARQGKPCQVTTEAILFTDTWITGEIPGLGPYAFLNTIAHAGALPGRILRPAVVMRIAHHYEPMNDSAYRSPMENDFNHYHGGDYLDEMAALASLFLGIRLKAGDVNREFSGGGSVWAPYPNGKQA